MPASPFFWPMAPATTSGAQRRRRHRAKRVGRKNSVSAPPASRPFILGGHLRRRGSTPLFGRAFKGWDRNPLSSFLFFFTPILGLCVRVGAVAGIANGDRKTTRDSTHKRPQRKGKRSTSLTAQTPSTRPTGDKKRQRRATGVA
ncbi:hypothetical protein pdul_cds_139 [Pandoravirus dulcis]|uniref:Uncharacterized protein n=1 Tax=Pandoravirus dulcis TaxID=1349409 RepID=S4VVE9_9VIRU|nr:hypothetical protein pdul_cds_139 [Pandoravirus dulcis]AGO82061.2 hypothetical protein pdul_cds_139 [Pandoravirus dulcis]